MADFKLTILGSNSAVPAHKRHPSAQILQHKSTIFLIDCGEGTQFQLNKYHIKRGNLDYILISHLHGDHYFGLVGLLNSLRLNSRSNDLHIYAPASLKQIILLQADFEAEDWTYKIHFHPLEFEKSEFLFETKNLKISSIPLDHRIDCCGFLIKEKPKARKINMEAIKAYQIPNQKIGDIKLGADFTKENGEIIANQLLTLDPPPSSSYAYCSDTKYNESVLPIIQGVDYLYHEATFLDEDKEKAALRFHSTTKEAALIANKAQVKHLIIGHYSAKYKDLNPLLDEAKSVFANSNLAIEGESFVF